MTTTLENKKQEEINYLNDLEKLNQKYSLLNAELLSKYTEIELGNEINKLNQWYDSEKQKLMIRSKLREGAMEFDNAIENTKDSIWNVWESLKNNVVGFFTTNQDEQTENKKEKNDQMSESDLQNLQYTEQQKLKEIVQQEMLNMYFDREASKKWLEEADDVFYMEKIKSELEGTCRDQFTSFSQNKEPTMLNCE